MKQKHLYSLLDHTFTTVRVVFDKANTHQLEQAINGRGQPFLHHDSNSAKRGYVYKVPKAWNVQEGDQLIVLSTEAGLAIVTVDTVDAEPDIDIDANFTYKWAVQRVDMTEYQSLTEREKVFQDEMLRIERVKQRESLVNSFRDSLPEGSEARKLFEQTTASLGGTVVDVDAAATPAE